MLAAVFAAYWWALNSGRTKFAPLSAGELGTAVAAGLAGVAWIELLKLVKRAR